MGRPAVVPPAGRGRGLDARPCRGAGGKAGGALSSKAPREGVDGSEIGALPGGRRVRWGWTERTRSLPGGGRPGWAAKAGKVGGRRVGGPGLQGDVAGWWCVAGPGPSPGGQRLPLWVDQRAAWNSSMLGVRTARRSNSLSVVSLPMALTRSRTDSGTWSNRVSRTSIIASRAFWTRPFSRPS